MTGQPTGWPFLVAAGRHRDYSILLAPRFLLGDLDYGFLEGAVRPTDGRPAVIDVRTPAGRHLTVVSATHTLTPTDAAVTHDEHGRPLRLLYGFVCCQRIAEPDPADLVASLGVALDAYRMFLKDEDAPVVAAGQPFTLHSAVVRRSEPVNPGPRRKPGRVKVSVAVTAAVVLSILAFALWPRSQAETPKPCASVTVTVGPSCPPTTPV